MTPIIIGLVGASSSGKSTVADMISKKVSNISIISLDNFYKGLTIDEQADPESYNFDEPKAIDFERFKYCISKLKKNETVNIPTYCFKTHARQSQEITIYPTKIILVEGILLFCNDDVRKLFDIKVFIDATPETRLSRRIIRDINERGRDIGSIMQQYDKFVAPSFDMYIKPTMKYVDLIIPNNNENTFIGVDILCKAIRNIHDTTNFI